MPIHGTSPQAKAAPATVTVGVTSTELIEAHDWRRSYAVQNTHDRNIVYLGFEHDATTDGIQLLPGQVWSDEDWRGRVSGIASGAGTTVAVVEFGG